MSKIRDRKGRTDGNSGYTRVIKNEELGQLLSRVQACVIANGTELEKIILERSNLIDDLEKFADSLEKREEKDGVYVCSKKVYAKAKKYVVLDSGNKKIIPDMLIFVIQSQRCCKVIELKDGDAFDTKKSSGEKEHLEEFVNKFGAKIPFRTDYFICCFNQLNKDLIYTGFKGDFDKDHILTGLELCEILGIDYYDILNLRKEDAEDNFDYFLDELLKINEVKVYIKRKI